MLLKEKRDRKIKSRKHAGMSKHSENIKKEDSESLTVKLDRIITTQSIEYHKGHDVANIYLPGEYVHTDTYKEIVMILKVILYELMALV